MSTLDIIIKYREGLVGGLLVTLQLCLLVWATGIVVGGALGYFTAHSPITRWLAPFWTAVIAISLINIFTVADIVRPVIQQFPTQYLTAARVYGLSSRSILTQIQLPLILRQITPPLLISQVTMLQATLFASLISVDEIFRVAQQINAEAYRPVQIYTALALFFIFICLPLNAFAFWLQQRSAHDLSES